MITLLVIILCLAVSVFPILFGIYRRREFKAEVGNTNSYDVYTGYAWIITGYCVFLFFFLYGLFYNLDHYSDALVHKAGYDVTDNKIELCRQVNSDIIEQLKQEISKYNDYEKGILTELKPENAWLLLSPYPNLKAIENVKVLLEQITSTNNEIRKLKIFKEDCRAVLLRMNANKFLLFNIPIENK